MGQNRPRKASFFSKKILTMNEKNVPKKINYMF